MAKVRFISDLHFRHKNMAIKRGFKDEFEHDNYLIDQWNKVVHKNDLTYILGDITMESSEHYYLLDYLKGRKIVVLGNHDKPNNILALLNYVDKIGGLIKYSQKNFPKTWLSHCPVHESEFNNRVKYNIHGHIHEKIIKDDRYINVCCEQIDYTPILFNDLPIK